MKCLKCNEILEDEVMTTGEDNYCPDCGSKLHRIYGSVSKYPEYPEGMYENFEHKPIYIKDREHFYKECKKRNLEPVVPKAAKEKKKRKKRITVNL